ncbi:MAG: hypothetical protein HFE99_00080 [Ruminiclostridium sp.]|nr:hypothetical protein [Ruminiclostridium sp.]
MSTIGTFDGFTAARLGIYAAQQGLSVTGNNISNINTTGYTRQVLDQISLKTGAYDRYRSQFDNHIGTGTLVRSINQIRDPYLDVRFRNTSADVGYSDAMLSGLDQIATILDEVGRGIDGNLGDGMLYAQIKKMQEALRELQKNPTSDNDTLVRQAADALVSLFNTYAGKLETLKENTEKKLNQEVTDVNKILRNIRELNEDIREAELHGDGALELRDERNRQIDELSSKLPISAVYTMEDIGGGKQIEKLSIYLNNANPDPSVHTDESMLVDGIYATQIDIPKNMPMTNPNWGKEPGDDGYDPAYADVGKDYQYVIAKTTENPDGTTTTTYTGTNDPMLATQTEKPNSNYLITIGKLLDSEDREWTDPTTTWTEVTPNPPGNKATYSYSLTLTGTLSDGDTVDINGVSFTIGKDTISSTDANDPKKLAEYIAKRLNGRVDTDYIVTAKDGELSYIAKLNGLIGSQGPTTAPTPPAVTVTPKDAATGPVTIGTTQTAADAGKDDTIDRTDAVKDATDAYGTVTNISYARGDKGTWYRIETVTKHTNAVLLDDNDLNGSIQAIRELLTEDGEFTTTDTLANVDENATTKRGIPYYQHSLDLLAQQFAKALNDLNKGYMVDQNGNYLDKDGNILQLEGTDAIKHPVNQETGLTPEQAEYLINNDFFKTDSFGKPILVDGKKVADLNKWLDAEAAKGNLKIADGAGVLFSNRNDNNAPTGITASNISISKSWLNREFKVVPTNIELFGHEVENTTKNENIGHIITILDAKLTYDPNDLNAIVDSVKNGGAEAAGDNIFIGSFNDMFSNMCTVLGNDQRSTNVELTSDYNSLLQIDTNRDGVSGVDLNDEAMNMMQYQKAYTAACRLMTAVDEALDRLINNTGIAGR